VPTAGKVLKKIGSFIVGPIGFLAVLLVIGLIVGGVIWLSAKALPWLLTASRYAFDVCIFVLAPLCIFRKTRPWAGIGFAYASFIFGAMLFMYSCLYVVESWGVFALVIGLFLAGVGVLPVALLSSIFHGNWSVLLELLLGIILTFGTRILGAWLTRVPEHGPISESDAIELMEKAHGI